MSHVPEPTCWQENENACKQNMWLTAHMHLSKQESWPKLTCAGWTCRAVLQSHTSPWASPTSGSESTHILLPCLEIEGHWCNSLSRQACKKKEGTEPPNKSVSSPQNSFLCSISQIIFEEADIHESLPSSSHLISFKGPLWQVGFKIKSFVH